MTPSFSATEHAYLATFRAAIRPDRELSVSDWADEHRILSTRSSPEPGKWRTSRTPYLRAVMDALSPSSRWEIVVLMAGSQVGKALAVDTPVPTTEGWTTMGEIQVGDRVFDENGQPCWVTGISPVFENRNCYRVRFSDGSSLVADEAHRWQVWRKLGAMREELCTRTTGEMLADWQYQKGNGNEHRYSIDLIGPLVLPVRTLPIDPYLLGYWLGNGAAHRKDASVHVADAIEVAAHLAESGHLRIRVEQPTRQAQGATALLVPEEDDDGLFLHSLRVLHLITNKHIPPMYQRAAISDRLALLQGLMDSDGSIDREGGCTFSTSLAVLRDNVFELIAGLGLKPTVGYTPPKINPPIRGHVVHSKENWRIRFKAYSDVPVFRLQRKLIRQRERSKGQPTETLRRRIVGIKPIASVPVRCIAVDSPSHLFAAGRSLIVSHNTECGNNWIGYNMHVAPGPMLAVQPTVEMAKRNSKQRIGPLIEDCPVLHPLLLTNPRDRRGNSNNLLAKEFPGGILVMTGANSSKGLRSMAARYLFLDEVDGYPGDVEGEGDPCDLAITRTVNFPRRKIFVTSTPVISGRSRIERFYEASDQCQYFVPCPRCAGMQTLRFECLRWPKGRPEKVVYVCQSCSHEIRDNAKTQMLAHGEWRPSARGDGITRGFHVSSLYSPAGWLSWVKIAYKHEQARDDREKLQVFWNTVLGRPWVEIGETPDYERLYERREHYPIGKVPAGGLLLTAGVDVQLKRIEVEIVAWGRRKQSWSIDYRVFEGDTQQREVWRKVAELLDEDFETEYGNPARITKIGVDTGFNTTAVYDFVRTLQASHVMAIKGDSRTSALIGAPSAIEVGPQGKRIRYGIRLWPMNSSIAKEELYRWLRSPMPNLEAGGEWPVGYCHFPEYSMEYFEQLTAEHLITRTVGGRRHSVWEKRRERNEALDCRLYARAAAASLRFESWKDKRWDDIEQALCGGSAMRVPRATRSQSPMPEFRPLRANQGFLE